VEVDEEGTKAAAATGITVGVTSVPVDQFSLVVDRPFLFAIVHQPTGVVLFVGVVRQP
jgi:serpin B